MASAGISGLLAWNTNGGGDLTLKEKKKEVVVLPYPLNGYDPTLGGAGGGYFGVPYVYMEQVEEVKDN